VVVPSTRELNARYCQVPHTNEDGFSDSTIAARHEEFTWARTEGEGVELDRDTIQVTSSQDGDPT
jgi:hypothetical protein